MNYEVRLKKLDNNSGLSIRKQGKLLSVNRSNIYYKSICRIIEGNIANEIYELWSKYCFFGYRKITAILQNQRGYLINHKKVLRLMRAMGLKAIYAKPRTTIANKEHNKYPYLLRGLAINKVNQVWMTDITYIKMHRLFI